MASEPKRACGGLESAEQTEAALGGTGLMSMPEDVTLNIVSRLDFQSLAATKRVCRRLSRIAHDESLFRRVTLVICDLWDPKVPAIGTNVDQLGIFLLDNEEEGYIRAHFHHVLRRLVKGGAELSALYLIHPEEEGVGASLSGEEVLCGLAALLKELRVKLRCLVLGGGRPELLIELVRGQPSLEVLDVGCFPPEAVEEVPNLRHLKLYDSLDPELLRSVVPQLRSLFFQFVWLDDVNEDSHLPKLLSVLREAGEGRLLLRAVGMVEAFCSLAFAVDDFRQEELEWRERHKSYWADAENRMPTPSLDYDEVIAFLRQTDEQQEKARQEKEAKEEKAREDEEDKEEEEDEEEED